MKLEVRRKWNCRSLFILKHTRMSKLRSVNTHIWSDTWFELLEPQAKLLFLYFITNEKTNMLGVYEISIKRVAFETGIEKQDVVRYLKEFEDDSKIKYAHNRVLLLNFLKHQNYNLNMMKSAIRTYLALPKELMIVEVNELEESKEGFQTLCNGFGRVRKVEVEYEVETKTEVETKKETKALMSEIKISDVEEGLKEYYEIAEAFRQLFKKNIKEAGGSLKHIETAKFKSYVNPIRLLITSDGATRESLIKIFQYLNSQEGNFWKSNIQSTSKLREKYNTLILKIKNSNGTITETNQQIFDRGMASETAKNLRFS